MKLSSILSLFIIGILTSCYKVYDPEVNEDEKVLVVNGLITNKPDAYHVILTYAKPFNSDNMGSPVSNAIVFVTDTLGNYFKFNEDSNGDYVSDSSEFTAQSGQIYRLHITTPDGSEFESDSQKLFPEVYPDSVYAEFDNQETLDMNSGLKVNTHGANILVDIRNDSDSIPRYRLTSKLVYQYYKYSLMSIDGITFWHFDFYCWQTVNPNPNINMNSSDYSLNSSSIKKHLVCFIDDNFSVWALFYSGRINEDDTTGIVIKTNNYGFNDIHHRIINLNLYTLNNETYIYYKSLDEQMQSKGKLFDPIAEQLNGNIRCKTDPEKRAIGFFEASSVSRYAYIIDFRNLINSQPSVIKTIYIEPPELNGCRINRLEGTYFNIPSFWIFI
ncbi:MAG TPA: DUF4249 domain-containing protein [Bacteroidales bacterium]|nr:DUF4249 domain-containing protein [Bacteroidales bacterium]